MSARKSVEDLRRLAALRLARLSPQAALEAVDAGAILVDIRSEDDRWRDGVIPGAVHHPLSVLAWRLDPDVETSNEKVPFDAHVILVCREGYSSVFAAVLLQELGFTRATDVIGGIEAWVAAELPLRASQELTAAAPPR